MNSISQTLERELSTVQVLLISRLDRGIDLAHEMTNAQMLNISQSDLALVGQLDVLDGTVVNLQQKLAKLLDRAELEIELELDQLGKEDIESLGHVLWHVFTVCQGLLSDTAQFGEIIDIQVLEQGDEGDLGARVNFAILSELLDDGLEVSETLTVQRQSVRIGQSLIEPLVHGSLCGDERLGVVQHV